MNLHFCCLNWSNWSSLVQGYDRKVQYRHCNICDKVDFRLLGYDKSVSVREANAAAFGVSTEEIGEIE